MANVGDKVRLTTEGRKMLQESNEKSDYQYGMPTGDGEVVGYGAVGFFTSIRFPGVSQDIFFVPNEFEVVADEVHEFVGEYSSELNNYVLSFDPDENYPTFSIGYKDDEHEAIVTMSREGLTALVRDVTLYLEDNREEGEK